MHTRRIRKTLLNDTENVLTTKEREKFHLTFAIVRPSMAQPQISKHKNSLYHTQDFLMTSSTKKLNRNSVILTLTFFHLFILPFSLQCSHVSCCDNHNYTHKHTLSAPQLSLTFPLKIIVPVEQEKLFFSYLTQEAEEWQRFLVYDFAVPQLYFSSYIS